MSKTKVSNYSSNNRGTFKIFTRTDGKDWGSTAVNKYNLQVIGDVCSSPEKAEKSVVSKINDLS